MRRAGNKVKDAKREQGWEGGVGGGVILGCLGLPLVAERQGRGC